jgi:hypothetical protein
MKSRLESFAALAWIGAVLVSGCSLDQMATGARVKPFSPSEAFADRSSARPPVPFTVARGHLDEDDLLYRGEIDGRTADLFPFPITHGDLARGRERFDIHCSPCHGRTGEGDGIVVQRGFMAPPSYFTARLREAPAGHFFQVITDGHGAMASYADQIAVPDRWRIVAYIRALQLSRSLRVSDLSQEERRRLESAAPPGPGEGGSR